MRRYVVYISDVKMSFTPCSSRSVISFICCLRSTAMQALLFLDPSCFHLVRIPQRIYIGGYHATSHTRCYLAFTGLALICILLSKVIAANHLFRILTTAALMGIAIFFSPIEATNKPLGKKKRLSYKMVASVLSSIDFLFAIFNVLPDTRSITVYYISKWVLVIFAIIPFFQKQAKIS